MYAEQIEQYNTQREARWDKGFLEMSRLVSLFSKDPSTKTGAVITRPDHTVCSMGFNGFPKTMYDDPALYANREEKYSRVVHCEVNAVLFAREPVQGYTLYTWPFASCDRCCVQMLQAGITRFVFPAPTPEALEPLGRCLREDQEVYCGFRGDLLGNGAAVNRNANPKILSRLVAAFKAIREYKRSKFSRYGGSSSMFGSIWVRRTVCDFEGHYPRPGKPHHLPTCARCHSMVARSDKLAIAYPKAPPCPGCWRDKVVALDCP